MLRLLLGLQKGWKVATNKLLSIRRNINFENSNPSLYETLVCMYDIFVIKRHWCNVEVFAFAVPKIYASIYVQKIYRFTILVNLRVRYPRSGGGTIKLAITNCYVTSNRGRYSML